MLAGLILRRMSNDRFAVSVKDAAGAYVRANDAFTNLLGVSPEDLPGLTDEQVQPRDVAETLVANDRSALGASGTLLTEERYSTVSGCARSPPAGSSPKRTGAPWCGASAASRRRPPRWLPRPNACGSPSRPSSRSRRPSRRTLSRPSPLAPEPISVEPVAAEPVAPVAPEPRFDRERELERAAHRGRPRAHRPARGRARRGPHAGRAARPAHPGGVARARRRRRGAGAPDARGTGVPRGGRAAGQRARVRRRGVVAPGP